MSANKYVQGETNCPAIRFFSRHSRAISLIFGIACILSWDFLNEAALASAGEPVPVEPVPDRVQG